MEQVARTERPNALETYAVGLISAVLDRLCVPFLMLDANGDVLFENTMSQAILADGGHIARQGHSQLVYRSAAAAAAVRDFINASIEPPDDVDLMIAGAPDRVPLHVTLSRFRAPAFSGVQVAPIVVLFFREASEDEAFDVASQLYGLSKAERNVVRAVLGGIALREYALARNVSVHTARKQFNTAMQKAGVSSKLQLKALIEELGRGRGRVSTP